MAAECTCSNGLHVFEDHFYPEIVDPASGELLPDGREGELVLTTLSNEAMPLIRFRTGDLTTIARRALPCGRTMRRIRRIGGRRDDSVVVEGVHVCPAQYRGGAAGRRGHAAAVSDRADAQNGTRPGGSAGRGHLAIFSDRIAAVEARKAGLPDAIEQAVGVGMAVRLVEPHAIAGGAGDAQARRVIDRHDR